MIKRFLYFCFFVNFFNSVAENNPQQEDLFALQKVYTVINNTQEPMDYIWQSGGGDSDVQTGRKGSFHLSPNTSPTNRHQIVTSGSDCIDMIKVTSGSFPDNKAEGKGICKRKIEIEYEGDLRNQKLVLKVS